MAKCRDCEQEIGWRKTANDRWQPIDPETSTFHFCPARFEQKFEKPVESFDEHCFACGYVKEPILQWQFFANGVLHLSAYCSVCGTRIRSVPQSRAYLERAPVKPS